MTRRGARSVVTPPARPHQPDCAAHRLLASVPGHAAGPAIRRVIAQAAHTRRHMPRAVARG
jgi:hypothetical protein